MPPQTKLNFNSLIHTQNGHNKFYEIWVIPESGRFSIYAKYGQIGYSGRTIKKGNRVSLVSACSYMTNLINDKLDKGYLYRKAILTPTKSSAMPETEEKRGYNRFENLE